MLEIGHDIMTLRFILEIGLPCNFWVSSTVVISSSCRKIRNLKILFFNHRGVQINISSLEFVSTRNSSSKYIVSNHPLPTGGNSYVPHDPKSNLAT